MLLLDYQNVLIESLLKDRFSGAAPTSIDQIVSDFDGVTYHISTPTSKTKILISLSIKCYNELVNYGAQAILEREYGPLIVQPESGYDFSLEVDLENLPEDPEAKTDLIRRISLLRRNAMAAPFEQAFDEYAALQEEASKYTSESAPAGMKEGGEVKTIHYREEEAIYIKASQDRVTVIFSTIFREETDRIFGKVFLQEFVDARRRAIQNAPQVLFRNDPPLELQGLSGLPTAGAGEVGYITFVLFPRHLTAARREEVISHIETFRDYFHYHIKAAKAYINTRMRRRTADFLQSKTHASYADENMFVNSSSQYCVEQDPRLRRRSARQQVEGPLESSDGEATSSLDNSKEQNLDVLYMSVSFIITAVSIVLSNMYKYVSKVGPDRPISLWHCVQQLGVKVRATFESSMYKNSPLNDSLSCLLAVDC